MLYRKIEAEIEAHLRSEADQILVIEGARQTGKSFIIREVGKRMFPHFVEVNFVEDDEGQKLFQNIHSANDFYFVLSSIAGDRLGNYDDTLVFLDEIQHYPQYLTMLKFLREDHRFRFIASGSLLGIRLRTTTSIPIGSIIRKQMYQLDFEEFLIANGFGREALVGLHASFENRQSLSEEQHRYVLDLFRRYLFVGGMPAVVNEYLASHNLVRVRELQNAISGLYEDDASKYELEAGKKMTIRRIYSMIVSQMENKKKRIVAKDIQGRDNDRFERYEDDFEYLISSGIAICVRAVSNPRFPLSESLHKNLLKLYLNDVGMLTAKLYGLNTQPIIENQRSVNLGAVYESAVAQELRAHGNELFYYDNRSKGEVDFLIDDFSAGTVLPIEVKSGRDYQTHSALNNLLTNPDYAIRKGIVLSNEGQIREEDGILYLPVYYAMYLGNTPSTESVYI